MLRYVILFAGLVALSAFAQTPTPAPSPTPVQTAEAAQKIEGVWNVKEGFDAPESAVYVKKLKSIFITNIVGGPTDRDGKGWISQITKEGKVKAAKWLEGFHAPKGIAFARGTLFVADIDEIIEINVKKKKITKRHKVAGAQFLNDVAIDSRGRVFVSDMLGNKIYVLAKGKVSVFAEGAELESPNGLLVDGKRLYVTSWGMGINPDFSTKELGHLFSLDLKTGKDKQLVTERPLGNLDGLQKTKHGFLVSDWMAGKVYAVSGSGETFLVVSEVKGAADLAVIPEAKIFILPRMQENLVSAFPVPIGR